jgi:hypothetical protein
MWCWRRMEKISGTDHVRNEDVLLIVKEQRNILHEIRKRKANCIGHILRRNCLLQRIIEVNPLNTELNPICCLLALLGAHHFLHVSRIRVKIQGGIEVTERQGRRCTKPLDDLKEMRGYSHLN